MASNLSVYAIRRALLRDFKEYLGAPIPAKELVDISLQPPIVADRPQALQEAAELLAMGYIEAIPGWNGEYLRITERGLKQLAPEFPRDPFIYGPAAAV